MSAHLDEETLAALALDPAAASEQARAHVATCDACRREVEANEALLREVSALPALTPSPAALERTKNEIVARMRTEARQAPVLRDWVTGGVTLVVGAVGIALLADFGALADRAPLDVLRWALALGVLSASALLATRPVRTAREGYFMLGGAVGLSVLLGAVDLATESVGIGELGGCEKVIALIAAAPVASALFYLRSQGSTSGGKTSVSGALGGAIGGAAGALAGQAVLMTTCASPEGFLHVLGFHVLALLGVTAVSALLGRTLGTLRPA